MSQSGPSRQAQLTWTLSGHARRLLTLALAGLVIAVLTRRPEFAGVAAPAVLLLSPRRPERPGQLGITAQPTATSLSEGQQAAIRVTVTGNLGYTVGLRLRPGSGIVSAAPGTGLSAGPRASLAFQPARTGHRSIGTLEVRLRDRWALTEGRASLDLPWVNCYPRPARQDTRVVLSRLPNRLGEHPSRAAGEGTEFTGVREFMPGDRQRRINWPATTRRGRLQLNTFATERTQTVVIIADVGSDVGEPGSTTLDLVLRGAAGAARAYLSARDRVGFISYAGSVRWTAPGPGNRQFYRIMDLMLAEPAPFTRGGGIRRLPRAALPPGALIWVFTPLLDWRLIEAIRDLRERGFALLVVDVLNSGPPAAADTLGRLARRIWLMEQEAIRFSLRELGIPLVHWDGQQSLDQPLAPYTRRVMVNHR